jgi:hypothetical protein
MTELNEGNDPDEALGDVVDAAQMYLSECHLETLAIIPQRCMPYPIISAEDVELYAHKLRKECIARKTSGAAIPPELEAMREFFARAARVIYLLRAKDDQDIDQDSAFPPVFAQRSSYGRPPAAA